MFRAIAFSAALMFLVSGCDQSQSGKTSPTTTQHTNLQTFQVKGIVIQVKPEQKAVVIRHEDVNASGTNYMQAMTMPFDVKDTNELENLGPGDPVTFRLLVTDTEGWIDHLVKTGPKTNLIPANAPIRRAREVEPLNEGDELPQYHFVNQFGTSFGTDDFRGQALAIEFLFTRCPLPNFCPLLANNFAAAQKQLLASPNAPTNWHLLTISFDPEFDTPEVLKRYAESHGYDSNHWTFATGAQIDISAIAEQFGVLLSKNDSGGFDHNLRAAVIDPSGRVRKIFIGNEWQPQELVEELSRAATSK